ncbi:uncharacterized protein TNCV_2506921 [Trichonephila clavipes]|uniref:Nucleic-acid-binding protein from mobile element jockey n=1 Tax=Trichonephila clavipes TaxID=2585209 RepID=A0A8X6WGC1_TRICX|nr:uncharacterized protein TNCV_2506921 [Trichonephila clavipes]
MSESSDYMELSPSKFDQVSACAKLRDTVTGISALHLSIHGMDGRSPSPGNSFMDMYISGKQAMIRRKEEMVKVEGYLVRGITQCFNCNNFYHTAVNCFMKPRCLKCGKDHATRNCHIKQRQENPFCINCQDFGHSACYTKCPKFPQPKKGTAFSDPIKRKNFSSKWTKEGISFANVVSGEIPNQIASETENLTANKKEDSSSGFLTQDNNSSDFSQVLELFNTISNLVKKNPQNSRPSLNLKQQIPMKKKPAFWQKL